MDNSAVKSQFTQILTAAKERRGDLSVDTMIVSSHLAQMKTFMLRRGIEFYADQDSYGKRKEFLEDLCEKNMLEMKFDSIVDYFLCDGQGLFYFRPAGDNYQILYFAKDQYRAYRNQQNELDKVVLVGHEEEIHHHVIFNLRKSPEADLHEPLQFILVRDVNELLHIVHLHSDLSDVHVLQEDSYGVGPHIHHSQYGVQYSGSGP